ncbi:MAG: BrnT family toxin [Phycisphaerales bacterium]
MLIPEFEFDPRKSAANLAKHGIDFVSAQELWLDPELLEIDARNIGEARTLARGRIGPVLWSALVTTRAGRIRIISVRRARQEERKLYEAEDI